MEGPKRSRSILRVGGGRGFVIEKNGRRFVITAAHCLRAPVSVRRDMASKGATLPPAHGASYSEERIYPRLLGPLGKKPRGYRDNRKLHSLSDRRYSAQRTAPRPVEGRPCRD